MIDTDKYEEHTEGPWWINHKDGDGATSIWSGTIDEGDMNHVADVDAHDSDLRLIADAPLLLAELKRVNEQKKFLTVLFKLMNAGNWYEKYCTAIRCIEDWEDEEE